MVDVLKVCDCWPDKGMLTNIQEVSYSVGGCVCNTAIDLKKLDEENTDVAVYGRIGKDEYGDFAMDVMKKHGLDVSNVKRTQGDTSYTDVMTDKRSGERTFFQRRGVNASFSESDVDLDALNCEIFHLGYLLLLDALDEADEEFGTKAARLLHMVQMRGIKTSIDLVSEQSERFQRVIIPALQYCDYVVINEVEAGRLSGLNPCDENGNISVENLKEICKKRVGYGVKECVTIHCPQLGCTMEADGTFTVVPSLVLPKGYIVGAVGAGDAFCAGMLYSFLYGMDRELGLRLASCMAACCLSAVDSISGGRSLSETMKLEKIYKRGKL